MFLFIGSNNTKQRALIFIYLPKMKLKIVGTVKVRINTQYSAARDLQTAQKPVETALIHIFEEKDIRLMKKENKEEFLTLIQDINSCSNRKELKGLIEKNRHLIEEYSPLMYESTSNLNNLDFEETKEKCRTILIPAN